MLFASPMRYTANLTSAPILHQGGIYTSVVTAIGMHMISSFSKWPGAWERHLIRRYDNPQYFETSKPVTEINVADAQTRDQQELALFHSSLETLIERCMTLTEETNTATLASVKQQLDACHDTAFGLAADLTEQQDAISALNEIITSTMQRSLDEEDEMTRLRLIQKEGARMAQLHRLEYPIVCDLLRSVCPIPKGELTGALLSEPDSAYKAALEILDTDRKTLIADRIDTILSTLESDGHKEQVLRKLELLKKQLPYMPATDKPISKQETA